ncbi:MAG: hypothetical protein COX19_06045 [Desulfobacterales bacterium CG23_combo_of_CG06-09_8_20_14_all_51_8]|nr:MAG: hypothetical protein COX19_06045 [Desulfobacterales bacterium CG23_combo_of_CG06-09_8_20_14_all_51_8]
MENYHEVYMSGASCYTDAAILNEESLYLVSLYGRPGSVKAIGAGILSGRAVFVGDRHVTRPLHYNLRAVTQNIENGLCHKVIFSPSHFTGPDSRILVGEDKKSAFSLLNTVVSMPLKEEWADFLWDRVFVPKRLIGFGQIQGKDLSEVYLVSVEKTTDEVDALVLEEIRSGMLN